MLRVNNTQCLRVVAAAVPLSTHTHTHTHTRSAGACRALSGEKNAQCVVLAAIWGCCLRACALQPNVSRRSLTEKAACALAACIGAIAGAGGASAATKSCTSTLACAHVTAAYWVGFVDRQYSAIVGLSSCCERSSNAILFVCLLTVPCARLLTTNSKLSHMQGGHDIFVKCLINVDRNTNERSRSPVFCCAVLMPR